MHGIDRSAGGSGGGHREEITPRHAEADLLTFHVDTLYAQLGHQRITAAFNTLQDTETLKEDGVAMIAIFHQPDLVRRLADDVVELAPPVLVKDYNKECLS